MNVSWLTMRDLEYIVAVAQYEHFGRAAESCHVSQPSLSAQVKKVEAQLGMELFERTNRRVSITPEGKRAIAQARIILGEAQRLIELVSGAKEPLSGPLRLGAIATLGPYLLPYVLEPLRKRYPQSELLLREGLTDSLIADLRAGELDFVLASPTFDDSGLKMIPLFDEPFLLVAPKEHKISSKSPLNASDLRSDEMVLLEDGHCLKDQTLSLCPANRRGGVRRFHATSLETLIQLVASGHGYTLIPKLAVREDPRLKSLVSYRSFQSKEVGRGVALYCREKYPKVEDAQRLAELIQSCLPRDFS